MSILNHRTIELLPGEEALRPFLLDLPRIFAEGEGQLIHDGRNQLRRVAFGGKEYVVKAFRRPNIVNRLVYGTLRASKALRAVRNALELERLGIGTPHPVGYLNLRSGLLFDRSFLVTEASTCTLRYDDFFTQEFPFADEALRAIARTTARLHDHGLTPLDHSRGNILFDAPAPDGTVRVELVDLNRMRHGAPLSLRAGCKNFERLPATPHMHRVLAEAYAEARGFDADECFRLMQQFRSTQSGKIDGRF